MFKKKTLIISLLLVVALMLPILPSIATETVASRSFVIENVTGSDHKLTKGTDRTFAVRTGTRLAEGYTLATGRASYIGLKMDDNSMVNMDASTKVDVSRASRTELKLTLVNGAISVSAGRQNEGNTTSFAAGNTAMGIRGTIFTMTYLHGNLCVVLLEGELEATTPEDYYILQAGYVLEVSDEPDSLAQATDIYPIELDKLDSFTLGTVRDNVELLIENGIITEEEAKLLDDMIAAKKAEEESSRAQSDNSRPSIVYLSDSATDNSPPTISTTVGGSGGGNYYQPANPPVITYAVMYDMNGGTTGTAPTRPDTAPGATFAVAGIAGVTQPANEQFKEWNTMADGSGSSYLPGDTVTMPSSALTLYALWVQFGSAPMIDITNQPNADTTVTFGSISETLTIAASVSQVGIPGIPAFQWYSCSDTSYSNALSIPGATTASFALPVDLSPGTYYYYCLVTAPDAVPKLSNVFTVTVVAAPLLIYTVADLEKIGTEMTLGGWSFSAHYILMDDITITSDTYMPIGSTTSPFNGTFDGNGNKITLNTNQPASNNRLGLFDVVGAAGIIENLELGGSITGYDSVGGISHINFGTITDCTVSGDISLSSSTIGGANRCVGGVAAFNLAGGEIISCTVSGDVSGSSSVGGAALVDTGGVAYRNSGTITDCTVLGDVSGNGVVGGVASFNDAGAEIIHCTVSGNVSGNNPSSGYAGGVANYNSGTITDCTVSGDVFSYGRAGGVVVSNQDTGIIENCEAQSSRVLSTGSNTYLGRIAVLNIGTLINNRASSLMDIRYGVNADGTGGTSKNIINDPDGVDGASI